MGMYDRIRAMTIRQLGVGRGGKGSPVTLYKQGEGEFNPVTGRIEGAGTTEYAGSGLRVNYTNFEYKDEAIEHGDFQLYLSPVLLDGTDCPVPEVADTFSFLGDVYKVINIDTWNAAGVSCGWKAQSRKG